MLVVGIGEYIISKKENESIITHALGSCVAFIIYCPETKYTALAHIVLPQSNDYRNEWSLDEKKGYFADLIVPSLLDFFLSNKKCNRYNLQVSIVGGADALNKNDIFEVGKKNIASILRILTTYQILPKKMDIGSNESRTVSVKVSNGEIIIKKQKMIL